MKNSLRKDSKSGPRDEFNCPSDSVCPLNRIRAGTAVRIKKLCANPDISRRLREIGFYEEQIIRLVNSQTNFICQICNTRLAISSHVAQTILVEPVSRTAAMPKALIAR